MHYLNKAGLLMQRGPTAPSRAQTEMTGLTPRRPLQRARSLTGCCLSSKVSPQAAAGPPTPLSVRHISPPTCASALPHSIVVPSHCGSNVHSLLGIFSWGKYIDGQLGIASCCLSLSLHISCVQLVCCSSTDHPDARCRLVSRERGPEPSCTGRLEHRYRPGLDGQVSRCCRPLL